MRSQTVAFQRGFGATLRSGPFRRLCIATFLVFNGFIMISSFQSYVVIYYVFGGDQELGHATRAMRARSGHFNLRRHRAHHLAGDARREAARVLRLHWSLHGGVCAQVGLLRPGTSLAALGARPFLAFGLGGLFTLMGAMIADVVDTDELQTHQRREGMFGSIFWWVVKVGMAVALAAGGLILNATGFDVALGGAQSDRTLLLLRLADIGIPFLASGIALWVMAGYPLTEDRAYDVRAELEERRRLTPA